jgi:hypothetical protein
LTNTTSNQHRPCQHACTWVTRVSNGPSTSAIDIDGPHPPTTPCLIGDKSRWSCVPKQRKRRRAGSTLSASGGTGLRKLSGGLLRHSGAGVR